MRAMADSPSTQLNNTAQSFGDISRFLREGLADEESRHLRESLVSVSAHIEGTVRARRLRGDVGALERRLAQLLVCTREHQRVLTGMGSGWHALYEFGAYQSALRELRDAVEAWSDAFHRRSSSEPARFEAFEQLAWRTLGEAMLLVDMYEQSAAVVGPLHEPRELPPLRRRTLWQRLGDWLRRSD